MIRFLFFIVIILISSCAQSPTIENKLNENLSTSYKLTPSVIGKEIVQTEIRFLSRPFKANNQYNLTYELSLVNHYKRNLKLIRIDVFDTQKDSLPFIQIDSTYLNEHFIVPGLQNEGGGLILKPSQLTIATLWLKFKSKVEIPNQIFHRLIFEIENKDKSKGELSFDVTLIDIPAITDITLGLPFKKGKWFYMAESHKGSRFISEGQPSYPQRFAIDWAYLEEDGTFVKGKGAANEDYPTYGLELFAVADGVVKEIKDSLPDNSPDGNQLAVKITRATIGGNYLVLDIGDNINAVYAHLIPNNIKVKVGDKVSKGQLLATLGNSGNSDGPHLHFHLETDANLILGGEGIPYHFEKFKQIKTIPFEAIGNLFEGTKLDVSSSEDDIRLNELPVENGIIEFE